MGEKENNNNLNGSPVTRWLRNAVLGATMADLPAMMTASGWRQNEKGDYVLDQQNDPHVKLLRDNLAAEGAGIMLGEFGLPALLGIYYTAKGLGKPMLDYGYNLAKKLKDPDMLYHAERNFLPKTLGNTILHPRPNPTGMSDKIWLSEGRPFYTSDGYTIYEIPKNKVITQPSGELFGNYYAGSQVTDQVNLLLDGINVYKYIQFPTHNGLEGVYGLLKFYTPSSLKKVLTAEYPLNTSYFKDKYGKEVTPTPYPGPDSDLANAVLHSLRSVLRDYFSPEKINQIKTTMNWGDLEISELLSEILRTIGNGPDVLIKGPMDGFTDIALHRGLIINSGSEAKGLSTVVLNRERTPDIQAALESGIHEIGVHGKTVSLKPENFGKGGRDDMVKEWFPRLAELSLKNKELADLLLQPNRVGKFLGLFLNVGDLEKYFVDKGLSWGKWQKFLDAWKRYKYVTASDETTARAYTGLLFNKVYDPTKKTLNIKLLELYNTPESVEAFKKAVLGVAPVATAASLVPSDKKGSKMLIKKKRNGKRK